jgi:glucuronoarabinoxylan endo-1,4-beta-xylanase
LIKISRGKLVRGVALTATLGLAVGSLQLAGTPAAAQPPTTVVSWDAERQVVDGFGGAYAFHKAGSVQRLEEPLTNQMLDMIWSKEHGIGMDMVRVMIGDGGFTWGDQLYDGPTETIMPEPGVFAWDDPDWEDTKHEFDAYQIWMMQEAQARGVEKILATAWSPPAWMKQNDSTIGTGQDNRIRPDMYQEFADYLADYVFGYKEHFDIDITHISPTNEPDLGTGYSSSRWTPEELNTFVRDHLGPTFEAREVPAQIVLGEAVGFSDAWARPALNDPVTRDYLDIVAAHAYTGLQQGESAPNPDEWALTHQHQKPISQTEYMNNGAPQDRVFVNGTITDGIRYASLIGNMFDMVDLTGYWWWWPASNSGADGSNLIRLMNDGTSQSPDTPTETGEYRVFKRYYTIGQYSRFIDPGWVMVDADKHPLPDVIVTAYKDPASDNFAVVVVNRNETTETVNFELDGFPGDVGSVVPYRTSGNENMAKLPGITADDGSFTMDLRGMSVTTFVPESHELPALPDRKDVFSTYLGAENDGATRGLRVRDTVDGEPVLSNIRHNSHVKYHNVNFADGSAAGFLEQKGELRMHATVAPMRGGTIEVRLGGPDGTLVGTMEVPAADDPRACQRITKVECDNWVTVSTDIDTSPDGAREYHDMYLVFKNGPTANTRMFHVDSFSFSD